MGWFIDFMDAASLILYGVDTKKAKQERAARRNKPGPIARGVATAGIVGAVASPGMAASALPGHEGDFQGQQWRDTVQNEQRNEQARGHRGATRDQGNRTGGSGQGR